MKSTVERCGAALLGDGTQTLSLTPVVQVSIGALLNTMEVNSLTERISVGGTSKLREDVTADQVGAGARVIEGHGLEDSRSKKGGIP